MEKLGRDEGWKEEYKVALKAYMRIAAEERAWAYHLSTDRAEADYRNGLILAEERGKFSAYAEMVKAGLLPLAVAAEKLRMSEAEFQSLLES